MTIYVDRIKDLLTREQYQSWTVGNRIFTPWIGNTRQDAMLEITLKEIVYHEEEYKGFQIVVLGRKCERRTPLDQNGDPFGNSEYTVDDSMIHSYKDQHEVISYYGYAYEVTDDPDPVIHWLSHNALYNGIGRNDGDLKKTVKVVKKKLDILSAVKAVKSDLIAMANTRFPHGAGRYEDYIPYNAMEGDHVFIQAHGRLRKGIIVGTTGSRFIVGYMTPSNSTDLKYKTLMLGQMLVEKTA